jgi:plastocyanin
MRVIGGVVIVATMLSAGCSDSTYSDHPVAASPAAPRVGSEPLVPAPIPTDGVTVDIVSADAAGGHFMPNPVRVMVGAVVYWRNDDVVPHRIVMKSTALDTGDIAPGTSSGPVLILDTGGAYFCAYHPDTEGIASRPD